MLWKRLNTETDQKVTFGPFHSFFKNFIRNTLLIFSLLFSFFSFRSVYAYFRFVSGLKKSYKFSVCWLVSFFLICFCKFFICFWFSEKLKIFSLLVAIPAKDWTTLVILEIVLYLSQYHKLELFDHQWP